MSLNLDPRISSVSLAVESSTAPQVRLLSAFELVCEGHPCAVPMSAQRLIAFLALRDRPLLRPHVAGTLWPDSPEERAAANLRSALWRVHQVSQELVATTRSHVLLGPDVWVDVRDVSMRAQRLIDGSGQGRDLDHRRLSVDLLQDWYDEWVVVERERFRNLRVQALESLCGRLIRLGLFGPAIQSGLAAVSAEPLRESSRRALIRAYLAEGNVAEAIRQYCTYRRLLFDELGVDPSPAMLALVQTYGRLGAGDASEPHTSAGPTGFPQP